VTGQPIVVIGAGADGLVAAHLLARAGRRVLVLERRTEDDPWPDQGWIPPPVIRALHLDRHELRVERSDPWIAAPLPGGGRLELWHDMARSVEAIRRVSPKDAARWPEFCSRLSRLARLLEALYVSPPPDLLTKRAGELVRLGGLGLRVRGLGKEGIVDLLRLVPMSARELLDDWFEHDALKGILGALSVRHLKQGPRSGGTVFNLLHHHVGSPPGVFRPSVSNLTRVLAAMPGIEIRRGVEVGRVMVRDGRATGVVLAAGGEEIGAAGVVSCADPRRTMLELTDPLWLDPETVRALRHIKCRGVAARVTVDCERPPGFEALAIAPSLTHIERAYDDAKYGSISRQPWLEARARRVDGRYRVEVHAQYAPYALADGPWDEARRIELGRLVMRTLAEQAPELQDVGAPDTVLGPRDLEDRYGWPEGHAYHGEMTLDQVLYMRPIPGWSRYRTPVAGLYLCGPGTHPGGGIPGMAGALAALALTGD
jgi:phytoene dehydrogenase-like protein